MTLFPNRALKALPFAKSIHFLARDGTSFDGAVLELPGQPKTFHVDGKSAEVVNLCESNLALIDLDDEHFHYSSLVIALENASPALSSALEVLWL
ncbi:hypothetical protein DFH94DRAFT_626988 [Russula ochroleuca]|uniref:Uncharacterized protein n=1 Tax=Russula ochroleuca TaxID=152965 RepID=A0A9P5MZT8_9AGAM|nr:hypothetical protein DFH94DRAFT_626988 [Russula ochroleuca]